MPVLFVIPAPLREFSRNQADVRIEGAAGPLSAALARLWKEHPGLRDRVMNERNEIRRHMNVFVDGEDIRYSGGLDTAVRDGAEVFLVPAVSGG